MNAKALTPAGEALFQTFDMIYVISLKRRHDRRVELSRQFRRLGFDFDHAKVHLFDAIEMKEAKGFPTAGARGCYLSNLHCLQDAEENGYGPVLVIEDDMDFSDDFEVRAPGVLQALSNAPWEVFYLGYQARDRFVEELGEGFHDIEKRFLVHGSHALAFSPSVRTRVVKFLSERIWRIEDGQFKLERGHVDGVFTIFRWEQEQCHTYVPVPSLANQRRSKSDIQSYKRLKRLGQVDFYRTLFRKVLGN